MIGAYLLQYLHNRNAKIFTYLFMVVEVILGKGANECVPCRGFLSISLHISAHRRRLDVRQCDNISLHLGILRLRRATLFLPHWGPAPTSVVRALYFRTSQHGFSVDLLQILGVRPPSASAKPPLCRLICCTSEAATDEHFLLTSWARNRAQIGPILALVWT
jgi:hypothetical protein